LKFRNPFRKKEKTIETFRETELRQTLEELLISGSTTTEEVTYEQAMNIPSVAACVNLIADTIASLPILLYTEKGDKVEVIQDDRVALLNDDTRDALGGREWKRAMIEEYLLNGNGYSYINRVGNEVESLNFVDTIHIGVQSSPDPIFKNHTINVNGFPYFEWEFIKLTRKSKNGVTGQGIIKENNKLLSVAYNSIIFEQGLVMAGGSKKGFLKSQGRLSADAITELKNAWNNLYKNNSDSNVVVLNNGLEFQEATLTAVELQMNEQKQTNFEEICKLFLVPPMILNGKAKEEDYNLWVKICIMPILAAFENAINKDLLLPSEKESFYFAFQIEELIKGSIRERYQAYEIGVKSGILQIDEVRFKENLPPLGLEFIKLGLQDVLYFSGKDEIYTPNTNKIAKLGEPTEEQMTPGVNGDNNSNSNQKVNANQENPRDNQM
jgi:HK97 family phage portal protein